MKWLGAEWHRILIALLTLDRVWERVGQIWERVRPLEAFIERRHNNMGSILSYLGLAKYAIPVIDAAVAEIKAAVPVEKADVQAAVTVVEKAIADLKTAIENLVTAVKAAIAQA